MIKKIERLFHTIKFLKFEQILWLIYFRVFKHIFPFKPIMGIETKLNNIEFEFVTYHKESWLGEKTFKFLNETAIIDKKWCAIGQSRLWIYNLHYFDYLQTDKTQHSNNEQAQVIMDWWKIHENKQGVAWESYPTSLRAVNLCKWHWENNSDYSLIKEHDLSIILSKHFKEIKRKLELHIQANHLFTNLKALLFLLVALPEYLKKESEWLKKRLKKELRIQFDSDGGHFELSPMYHNIILWDLFDLIALCRVETEFLGLIYDLESIAQRAITWAIALSHPDEEVSFFNDSVMGIAPNLKQLKKYAAKLNIEYSEPNNGFYSGYASLQSKGSKLICDAAKTGPDFQPGHSHADTLSFELSIGSQRVFVNSGVSEYGASVERIRQRSTEAHNTVVFKQKNSSDVWSSFRLGKRASIVNRSLLSNQYSVEIKSSHDGYFPFIHSRTWCFSENSLQIIDGFSNQGNKISCLYLHPKINALQINENKFKLEWQDGEGHISFINISPAIVSSVWHPEFGLEINNLCFKLHWNGIKSEIKFEWN